MNALAGTRRANPTITPRADALVAADRGLVWHPYAPLNGPAPYAVTGADGGRLSLTGADGTEFEAIDAMSSWWCTIHGYRNPVLDEAVRDQLDDFSHVMFGGLTHEPAVRLASQLVELAPAGLEHVFFADSGSVSVEVALKLALQYQTARDQPGRRRFVALRGAYHGDTTGAMSVCDPVDGMHSLFPGLIAEQVFLERPPAFGASASEITRWIADASSTVDNVAANVAAIIAEPVLQGAGGMWMYAPECLAALREIADRHELLLILDEIATGFGRTGCYWGADRSGVTPDVMCLGKALTGGYVSLAAVLCSGAVGSTISASEHPALLHGPTFMANPLACAVASASLRLLDSVRLARVTEIEQELRTALAPAASIDTVQDVRVLGAVGVVQLHNAVDVGSVTRQALDHGVWVRPFRDLVYTMPPYVCSSEEIATIGAAICAAVAP